MSKRDSDRALAKGEAHVLFLLAGDAANELPEGTAASDFHIETASNIAGNTVRVRHLPTGYSAVCGTSKSQVANRWACFADLAIQLHSGRTPKELNRRGVE